MVGAFIKVNVCFELSDSEDKDPVVFLVFWFWMSSDFSIIRYVLSFIRHRMSRIDSSLYFVDVSDLGNAQYQLYGYFHDVNFG